MELSCNDCKGTGKNILFISIRPCKLCGGTGKIVLADELFTEVDYGCSLEARESDETQNEGVD